MDQARRRRTRAASHAHVCEATYELREERCNSVDDDCNGEVDDLGDGGLCGCLEGRPTLNVQAACGDGGYQPTSNVGQVLIKPSFTS